MNFTKIDLADLNCPREEFSNGGLGIVVAPMYNFLENCGHFDNNIGLPIGGRPCESMEGSIGLQ